MNDLLQSVNDYYSQKVKEFGITPKGVDWNSTESQELRFQQLTKVIEESPFSILDYGCGYGALFSYLYKKYTGNIKYTGFDISEEMLSAARSIDAPDTAWLSKLTDETADYTIASGIFNVKLEYDDKAWSEYVLETLNEINKRSIKGFSFNMLTSFSDAGYMKEYLYYANPLYEFTIIVRK
jgi:SAM-dependent methyltransferase